MQCFSRYVKNIKLLIMLFKSRNIFFPCMMLCDETLGIYIQYVLSLRALPVGWGYVFAWNFGGDYCKGQD